MIERLHVRNFKCLLDTTVDLAPFTVLIGPNDSGKSSVLDALRVAAMDPAAIPGELGSMLDRLVWRGDVSRELTWKVDGTVGGHGFTYTRSVTAGLGERTRSLLIGGKSALESGDHAPLDRHRPPSTANTHLGLVVEQLTSSEKIRFDPIKLRTPSVISPTPRLAGTGENLTAVLDAMLSGRDRSAMDRLEADLREAVPTLHGISLAAVPIKGQFGKALEFTLAGPPPRVAVPAALASDGAVLLTAFLALVYGDAPNVLLIEEPENGLHPSRLKMVIDLLRNISEGKVGNRPRQVVVTTHSPILLNFARPEEVRIVERDAEKGTRVTPFTQVAKLDELLKEFGVGELWYMLGEEGLLRGTSP